MQPAWNGAQGYPTPQYGYYPPQQFGYHPAPGANSADKGQFVPYQVGPWPETTTAHPLGGGPPPVAGPPGQTPMPRPRHLQRPSNGNGTQPFPGGGESATVGAAGHTPMPRPKHLPRSQAPGRRAPLKSAMRKGRLPSDSNVPLNRERTPSDPRQSAFRMTRQRTSSMSRFVSDHIFLSFHGTNEFQLDFVHAATLEHVQEHILSMWPHGVDWVSNEGYQWRAHFTRNPWSTGGLDAIIARRMILNLFRILARHGYNFLTSIDIGRTTPRLVFVDMEAERSANFFLASFTRAGHMVTLIDPPPHIGESIGEQLRMALPHKIASDRVSEDGIYTVELKRNAFGAVGVNKNLFVSHVLKQINAMGFRLEAAVPLPKAGLLGFGSRSELWVFKERSGRSTGGG